MIPGQQNGNGEFRRIADLVRQRSRDRLRARMDAMRPIMRREAQRDEEFPPAAEMIGIREPDADQFRNVFPPQSPQRRMLKRPERGMMETNENGDVVADRQPAASNDKYTGWYTRFQEMSSTELPMEYMQYLVLDYLISQGYREAAEYLCEDASIPFPRDALENLDQRMRVRDDIVEGKIQEAIEKVLKIVPDLLERNPVLHLRLLQQHLIELIRNKKVEEAVAFTQSIFEKVDEHPEMEKEMQQAFAMIAFERPEDSPYTHLLEISHRQMVANDVNSAILEALDRPSAPKLEGLFRMILWSKKLLKHNDTPESLDQLFRGQKRNS